MTVGTARGGTRTGRGRCRSAGSHTAARFGSHSDTSDGAKGHQMENTNTVES